jgi:hypothetical protein
MDIKGGNAMIITKLEHWRIFENWCRLNGRKMSSGYALNDFCRFSKNYYTVR